MVVGLVGDCGKLLKDIHSCNTRGEHKEVRNVVKEGTREEKVVVWLCEV